jgi:hypothetical protein
MADSLVRKIRSVNSRLKNLLIHVREALAGRKHFDATQVRAIAEPVGEVAEILDEAKQLRSTDAILNQELKIYAEQLGEMQVELERVRFMLLARRAHVESMRGHLETLGLWSAALRLTR